MQSDGQLLQAYVREGSQGAFRLLVERHSHWLYSVCLRRLGDGALAEDATQAVFLALAQRARGLQKEKTISPWLHRAARYCTANLLRARKRRQRHELEAASMKTAEVAGTMAAGWQDIAGELEPALDRLGAADRAAILLKFYEQRSHPEIAAIQGITMEASQKRLSRALERLRAVLARQGAGAGLSAPGLGELLSAHGVGQAPATLAAALSGAGSAAANGMAPVAKQILVAMSLAWMKTAAVAAVVVLLAIPAGWVTWHGWRGTEVLAQVAGPGEAKVTVALPGTRAATVPATMEAPMKIANAAFGNQAREGEYEMGVDPATRRTAESEPAGHMKSLLPQFLPNDQRPAVRAFSRRFYGALPWKRLRITAWFKTSDVEEWSGLSIDAYGAEGRLLMMSDTSDRPLRGTMDWTRYEMVVDVPQEAIGISLSAFMFGKGEVWTDGFQLEAVGPEVALTDTDPWRKQSFFTGSYTAKADPDVVHDGHVAVCIASKPEATDKGWYSFDRFVVDVEKFRGHRVRATMWMKSADVSGGSGVWMNVWGKQGRTGTEGQRGHRPLKGTMDWAPFTAVVFVPEEAMMLDWGLVMNGTGKIWVDAESAQIVVDDATP